MSAAELRRIRNALSDGWYDLTFHAVEELSEDGLDIADVEAAVAAGAIIAADSDDARGTRYTVAGPSQDGRRRVGVVGRCTETAIFLIITAYEVTPHDD